MDEMEVLNEKYRKKRVSEGEGQNAVAASVTKWAAVEGMKDVGGCIESQGV